MQLPRTGLAALTAIALALGPAVAQEFPIRGKPLTILTGFPPGTAPDIYGRLIQDRVQAELGVPVVIDMRPGASGNIGMQAAARAEPDGHTVIIATSAMLAINPAVLPKMPIDTQADLVPLVSVFDAPNFMVVSTEKRPNFDTCRAVVDAARAAPGKLNYASTGVGASTHLAGAQFASLQGIDIVHVPYRGGPFAMTALLQGDVDVFFYQTGPVIEFYRQGKVRLLGTTSAAPVPAVPEIPTIAQACNMPGFESTTWYALLAPAGTPPAIVAKLREVFERVAREPAIEAKVIEWGFNPNVVGAEETGKRLATDVVRWRDIAKRVGARVE